MIKYIKLNNILVVVNIEMWKIYENNILRQWNITINL